jgi:hypothetical protein
MGFTAAALMSTLGLDFAGCRRCRCVVGWVGAVCTAGVADPKQAICPTCGRDRTASRVTDGPAQVPIDSWVSIS